MIDLSIVIPAHNEEGVIEQTVSDLALRITREGIVNEIVVVNDNSTDQTDVILEQLRQKIKNLKVVENSPPYGFGFAVRRGIEETGGNHIAIMMADASDDPEDLICFFRKAEGKTPKNAFPRYSFVPKNFSIPETHFPDIRSNLVPVRLNRGGSPTAPPLSRCNIPALLVID